MGAAVCAQALSKGEARERLWLLRDELVQLKSQGRFLDAAGREWAQLDMGVRMSLLLMAGVGDGDLPTLAARRWQEFGQEERAALRREVRACKRSFAAVTALAARV